MKHEVENHNYFIEHYMDVNISNYKTTSHLSGSVNYNICPTGSSVDSQFKVAVAYHSDTIVSINIMQGN